jgi:hypothetical protein
MTGQAIQWTAILLFGASLWAWAIMDFIVRNREIQKKRRVRGFRNMKSPQQIARERARDRFRY